jgi:acetoin utilization protein AcuB
MGVENPAGGVLADIVHVGTMQPTVPTVSQFMTPNPVIIDGGLSIADAFTRMFQIHARHLPVYTNGHLVGILSDRDIGHLSAVQGVDPSRVTAEQACSPNPFVCAPDSPLDQVVTVLIQNRFGAAIVMENGKLVGMFTVIDAMTALVAMLQQGATRTAEPEQTWSATINAGPDLKQDHTIDGPDLDKTRDRRDRPDLDQNRTIDGPDLDKTRDHSDDPDRVTDPARDLVHGQDPARDGFRTIEANRADIGKSGLQYNGATQGVSTDIRSDVGQRSALRRAAATVHRGDNS